MANIDKISVKNTVYNIVSPAVVSDYIEVIGGACTKPDGYEEDEVILAKQNDVQLLFKATQDIAFGANIVENTNCVRTTLEEVLKNAGGGGGASSADQVSYDNSASGLEAENVQEAVDELASEKQTLANKIDVLVENGAVNILPTATSTDKYNTHYVVDSDGSITVTTGTGGDSPASSNNGIYVNVTLEKGTYRLSGCPSGGASNAYYMAIESLSVRDYGEGAEFTVSSKQTIEVTVARINNTTTSYNGLVFKPMISDAALGLSYADYQPYAKTNRQLTEDSVDWDAMSKLGAVNLLEVTATGTTTKTGGSGTVDFTVNADKSITINCDGTHTSDVYFSCAKVTVPKGSWKFSALQANSSMTYFMYLDSVTGITYDNRYDSGNGTRFTNSAEFSTTLSICVKAGTALNNVTIYPMIAPVDYNGDYVPYAKTNRELTKELQIQDLFNDAKVSGFSYFTGSYLLKYGKIVNLSFAVSNEVSTETKVLALPVGCRPKGNTIVPLYVNGVQYGTAWIKADGDVTINPSEAKTYLGFSATFIAMN